MISRQGRLRVTEWFDKRVDPRDRHYYWMAGEDLLDESPAGEDFDDAVLREGYISVTPLHFDLTSFEMMKKLSQWDL